MKVDPVAGVLITLTHALEKIDLIVAYETNDLKQKQIALIRSDLEQVLDRLNIAFKATGENNE